MKLKDSIIIILVVVIAIVVGVFVGFKLSEGKNEHNITNNGETNNNENINDNNTEIIKYTYYEIKGTYTYEDEKSKNEDGNMFGCSISLFENGTFIHGCGVTIPLGTMGNYIIKDNNIVLNYLFETRSDANIIAETGSDIITISDKNTLLFTNATNWGGSKSSITLKRDTSSDENKLLQNGKKYFSDCLIKECKLNNQFVD